MGCTKPKRAFKHAHNVHTDYRLHVQNIARAFALHLYIL